MRSHWSDKEHYIDGPAFGARRMSSSMGRGGLSRSTSSSRLSRSPSRASSRSRIQPRGGTPGSQGGQQRGQQSGMPGGQLSSSLQQDYELAMSFADDFDSGAYPYPVPVPMYGPPLEEEPVDLDEMARAIAEEASLFGRMHSQVGGCRHCGALEAYGAWRSDPMFPDHPVWKDEGGAEPPQSFASNVKTGAALGVGVLLAFAVGGFVVRGLMK